jgi:hypothetical protein
VWVVQGRIHADAEINLGDVPVNQPAKVSVSLTNQSASTYHISSYQWYIWVGGDPTFDSFQGPSLAPGAAGQLRFTVTPHQLGPAVVTFGWLSGGQWDAATVIRLWAVPGTSG